MLRLPMLCLSLLVVAACGTVTAEEQIAGDLELETGGLDTTDEAPAFGDDAEFTAAAIEPGAPVTDALDADPEVVRLRGAAGATRLRVAVVWGQLPPDRAAAAAHDWSGRITVSDGALVVRRTIGFEDATDAVAARTARDEVAFTSVTRPFADGLVLEVLTTATDLRSVTLGYQSRDGVVAARLPLATLLAGTQVADVGTDGNRVMVTALRAGDPCDHGLMRGRWHALRADLGRFLGVVADDDGAPIGHLRGIWGQRGAGDRVFFGKYVDTAGRFRGLLVGTYADGGFRGRWLIGTGDRGRVEGLFRAGAPGEAIGGAFVGRWAETSCAADLPAP
ncbi:MAG: hypothetical protein R3B06_26495 [Kofleriaceae bacterium]